MSTNSTIDLENSDDEVQQLPIKVPPTTNSTSPYGRSKPPPLNATNVNVADIYNIVPKKINDNQSLGLAGFILVCTGKGIEYQFPRAVYDRHKEVLNQCHVVRNVFEFKINGIKQEGNKGYSKKALVWIAPQNTTFTKDDCVFLMQDYLNLCKTAGTINTNVLPSFDAEANYHEEAFWYRYINVGDLNKIYDNTSYLIKQFAGLKSFLKATKNNLYSIIQPGNAPMDFFVSFNITKEEYVAEQDCPRIRAFFPPPANDNSAVSTDNPHASIVTPASTPKRKATEPTEKNPNKPNLQRNRH